MEHDTGLAVIGFELMESTIPDGPVANWIEKKGEGLPLHSHARGEITRPFRDYEFAFIHPKKVNNVLLYFNSLTTNGMR